MQCPNCQHWNEPGSRFCEECGFELSVTATAEAAQVSVKPGNVPESSSTIPDPSPQSLIPPDSPPAAPYTGARIVLDATGSIFKLGDATVIGREDPSLQIDFEGYPNGKYISHRHAQIVMIDGKYYIEDLGSSNHTWVNEIKLASGQSEPLKDGDKIRFGKIELTFHE
jgi:pSer/pThr/pTyr-binding forkhead associated (FHA) protein